MNKELLNQAPPCDHEAEAAILGISLTVPERFHEISSSLKLEDFSSESLRTLYGAMLRLQALGHPIDITLLVGELRDFGEYNRDNGVNATTLVNLYRLYPVPSNLPYYIGRVKEMGRRRHALQRGINLVQAAYNIQASPTLRRRCQW
jgi:replicative DNA helicase